MSGPVFDAGFRGQLSTLLAWRRDVRRFRRDALPWGLLERLIGVANTAPSVGIEPALAVRDGGRSGASGGGSGGFRAVQCGGFGGAGGCAGEVVCAVEAGGVG